MKIDGKVIPDAEPIEVVKALFAGERNHHFELLEISQPSMRSSDYNFHMAVSVDGQPPRLFYSWHSAAKLVLSDELTDHWPLTD